MWHGDKLSEEEEEEKKKGKPGTKLHVVSDSLMVTLASPCGSFHHPHLKRTVARFRFLGWTVSEKGWLPRGGYSAMLFLFFFFLFRLRW